MAGITQAQAEAQLALYIDAEAKVLGGQAYTIGGRSLTRANLKEIRDGITYWNSQVKSMTRGGISIRGATPV
jgi:hypothetical protein